MRRTFLLSVALLLALGPVLSAEQARVEISISGMYCEGCATGIRAVLVRTDGVLKAEVSYHERRATVEYDPSRTSPEKIVAAVEKMGYKAQVKK